VKNDRNGREHILTFIITAFIFAIEVETFVNGTWSRGVSQGCTELAEKMGIRNMHLYEAFLQFFNEPVLMSAVFCVVTPCSLAKLHSLLRGTNRVNLQG
jgi:hypothetical protein